MKRLQMSSMCILTIGIFCLLLWQFDIVISVWFVRVAGLFLALSLFTLVLSSIKHYSSKK